MNEIKLGFVHTLCTPSKIKSKFKLFNLGKISLPHSHLIKDLMKPDKNVEHEAHVNP